MTDMLPVPAATAAGRVVPTAPGVPRDRNPYWVYIDSLESAHSRRNMRASLDRLARIIAGRDPDDPATDGITGDGIHWHLFDYAHTMRIRARLQELHWSPAYINLHLVALRRVLQEAWRLGIMPADAYQRATDIKNVKATRLPTGEHVPDEALAAALDICDANDTPAGKRDAALLAVLYSTGCRRAEVAGMNLADYNSAERSLRVIGKRNKERKVYLESGAVARMEAWLAVRGKKPGPLFIGFYRGGHRARLAKGRFLHLSGQAVADILTRRLKQAGASRKTPHDLRRTFIGNLLDAGVDLATAQALAGHDSPVTTAAYDRRPERTRQEAVDRLRLPDPKPLRP
ncbi:Site-specific recombinase XerD [Sinosporangium album]|uniref:Site-specific recombinase XerD n=1 Tax=Sinosporangium album TaxID=504805 RepID=A0A1G8E9Y3_9ACTN|nr:tyrosine-type recombinase/integrase [Sinosporangium album]SDH66713.1 Site-specific recombinase XerD [Sinosporangium album]